MKKIITAIMLVSLSLFGATNQLFKQVTGSIVDIGYQNPKSSYQQTVVKEWASYDMFLREVNKVIFTKARIVENFDCETDYLGRENCTAQSETCIKNMEKSDGYATKFEKVLLASSTKTQVAKNGCTPNDYTACENQSYFISGCLWGWHLSLNWKECGYSFEEHPSHWRDFGYYGNDYTTPKNILNSYNEVKNEFTYKAYETCLDYNTFQFKCNPDFKIKKLADNSYTCEKKYSYSEYKCFEDTNIYDRHWTGPVVDSGGDCNGQCSGYNCKCNPETPPKDNCIRGNFTCPSDPTRLCTITTEDKASTDNTINGYVYDKGTSELIKKTIEKEKTCEGDLTYNATTKKCEKDNSYVCLNNLFSFNEEIKECLKPVQCDGILNEEGECVTQAISSCVNGYRFNQETGYCEKAPICDKGVYNATTNLCSEKISCPTGYSYSSTLKTCVSPINIETLSCSTTSTYLDGNPDTCYMKGTLTDPIYSGTIKDSYMWCSTCTIAQVKNSIRNFATKIGATVITEPNGTTMIENSPISFYVNFNNRSSIEIKPNIQFSITETNSFFHSTTRKIIQEGREISASGRPTIYLSANAQCNSWKTIAATNELAAHRVCNDSNLRTYASCPNGYTKGSDKDGNVICYNAPICPSGFSRTENGTGCYKTLNCKTGYVQDYANNRCVQASIPGSTIDRNINMYKIAPTCGEGEITNLNAGTCENIPTCASNGIMNLETDRCITEATFSCPAEKTGNCATGYFFNNVTNTCEANPTCLEGNWNPVTNSCYTDASCSAGYYLNNGKCEKEIITKPFVCLSSETLDTINDVCKVNNPGTCPSGYTISLNTKYCERKIICETGYTMSKENDYCYK